MRKLTIIALAFTLCALCSCTKSPEDNAKRVSKAVDNYCEIVEEAINDGIIDDDEVSDIKDAEKEYMDLIKFLTDGYSDDPTGLSEFQQAMYSDEAWMKLSDVCIELANTEGYAKLSLTDK